MKKKADSPNISDIYFLNLCQKYLGLQNECRKFLRASLGQNHYERIKKKNPPVEGYHLKILIKSFFLSVSGSKANISEGLVRQKKLLMTFSYRMEKEKGWPLFLFLYFRYQLRIFGLLAKDEDWTTNKHFFKWLTHMKTKTTGLIQNRKLTLPPSFLFAHAATSSLLCLQIFLGFFTLNMKMFKSFLCFIFLPHQAYPFPNVYHPISSKSGPSQINECLHTPLTFQTPVWLQLQSSPVRECPPKGHHWPKHWWLILQSEVSMMSYLWFTRSFQKPPLPWLLTHSCLLVFLLLWSLFFSPVSPVFFSCLLHELWWAQNKARFILEDLWENYDNQQRATEIQEEGKARHQRIRAGSSGQRGDFFTRLWDHASLSSGTSMHSLASRHQCFQRFCALSSSPPSTLFS